jgi:MFS family permease
VGITYTLAQIFTPPPYNLTVSQNGYFFTGALVGGLLGVSAGPLSDLITRLLSKRNNGIYEAEFRIPLCIFAVILFAVGWFTFAWALDHPTHSRVYLCSFCFGAISFGTSVASTSAGLYVL